MKNTKERDARRQKKLAKKKAQRVPRVNAYKERVVADKARLQARAQMFQGAKSFPVMSDDDYVFWLCHGANFLASDSTNGVWNPIFDRIYQEELGLPSPEEVATKVLSTYQKEMEDDEKLTGVPRAVLAWSVTDKTVVSIYRHEAERRLREKDPDCDAASLARSPHNPVVWGLMDQVKARSLKIGEAMDENLL